MGSAAAIAGACVLCPGVLLALKSALAFPLCVFMCQDHTLNDSHTHTHCTHTDTHRIRLHPELAVTEPSVQPANKGKAKAGKAAGKKAAAAGDQGKKVSGQKRAAQTASTWVGDDEDEGWLDDAQVCLCVCVH